MLLFPQSVPKSQKIKFSANIYILALANVATDVESNIKEIIDMWKEDEKKDNEFQVCSYLLFLWCCSVYFL